MDRHFHEELKQFKGKLIQMGDLVVCAIENAVKALLNRDQKLASQVIEEETKINQREIEIDEEGHKLSTLGQPMASDMRLITSILKINTDLERLGDHAVNIAERTFLLLEEPRFENLVKLPEMASVTLQMLKDALSALKNEDVELARSVLSRDDEVDNFNDDLYFKFEELMEKDPSITRIGMNLVMVGHNLERIADLSNNIAENVIYLKQGKEVRHRIAVQP